MIKDLLFYMKRHDNYWRMDMNTYFHFMKHVYLYFREKNSVSQDIQSKLTYVEISAEDLSAVCFLFGGYSRDNEIMMITEIFPEKIILPWEKTFTLNLYTKDDEFIPVIMDARWNSTEW